MPHRCKVIERATGTIRGRAVFANANGVFTPGMFARVRVPGSPPYEGLLVPDVAIGTEQARRYVVVDGLMQARPGTKVHAEEQGTKPAAPVQAGGPPQKSK